MRRGLPFGLTCNPFKNCATFSETDYLEVVREMRCSSTCKRSVDFSAPPASDKAKVSIFFFRAGLYAVGSIVPD